MTHSPATFISQNKWVVRGNGLLL